MSAPLAERLRPRTIDEYIGQEHLVGRNGVFRKFFETGNVPSFILWGPPGVGKTTLARIVATQLERPFFTLSAVTSGVKEVREVIESARKSRFFDQRPPFLFIDEIHRLNRMVEEVLYPALEDFALDIVVGKGPAARSIRLDLPRFTLVGATTRSGMLTGPLRDRFGISFRLDYYSPEELAHIILRSAALLDIDITEEGALEIARRSRGTPRLANRLLKRTRDWAQVRGSGIIDQESASQALDFFEVDKLGLDAIDNRILRLLCVQYGGRPVGLSTIASALSEDQGTIEDVYEPYLMQQGLMMRTPKGRQATAGAWEHLGLTPPEGC